MIAPTVSLVLGSGGARGYAHIGAIEELRAQGYDIRSVAGSSMGALIGGIYAAGKLDAYRDWVVSLQRFDVLRMLDWTFRGGGLLKGTRIIEKLRELIGDVDIEDLPLDFTAVAVDLLAQREVWFSRGSLFEAIRASIAIPAVFRPHQYQGRTLVDGGLLNPVPITPTLRDLTDCTIAVDVNGAVPAQGIDGSPDKTPGQSLPVDPASNPPSGESDALAQELTRSLSQASERRSYRQRIASFFVGRRNRRNRRGQQGSELGMLETFALSLDAVQETLTRFKLAAQPPDLVVSIPRNACAFYEFHRAGELIELGRHHAREALRQFGPPAGRANDPPAGVH